MSHHHHDPGWFVWHEESDNWCDEYHQDHHHHNRYGHVLQCPFGDCLADYLNDEALAFDYAFGSADHTHDA